MIEVEIKLKIENKEAVRNKLQGLGFAASSSIREVDSYFDSCQGDIRRAGEALRVRRITDLLTGDDTAVVTFKGKKLDRISMTRQELETGVESAETMIRLFTSIGFHQVPPKVIKTRHEYKKDDMTACLDTLEGLGDFLELEIVTEENVDKDQALGRIEKILGELGYALSDTVTTSYLSMLQNSVD